MEDRELLRQYVESRSEPAFAELVARHINLVYGTARRIVHDPQAAQDVAQAVFILLARKAGAVRDGAALGGWLYRAAYREALDSLRSDQRRRQRETHAMNLAETNTEAAPPWENLAPLLDEAMQTLGATDQTALVLRYFEDKSVRETSAALAMSEAAAQKRLGRALEKMRNHFARRGVTVAVASLATAITAHSSSAAPAGLAAKVATVSVASAGSAGGAGIFKGASWSTHLGAKGKVAFTAAGMLAVALNAYQYRVNDGLEKKLAAAPAVVVVAANPVPRAQTAVRDVRITEDTSGRELELSIERPAGVPTLLRKVGAKFYPLTLEEMKNDPGLMKQFAGHFGGGGVDLMEAMGKMFPDPADRDAAGKILKERAMQTELLMLEAAKPNLTAAELEAFTQRRKKIFDDADAKLLALAPNEAEARTLYVEFQQKQAAVPAERLVKTVETRLEDAQASGVPALAAEQRDALLSMVTEERTKPDQPDRYESWLALMTGSPDLFAPQRRALEARVTERTIAILSPEQWAVLQQKSGFRPLVTSLVALTALLQSDFGVTQMPLGRPSAAGAKAGELIVLPPGQATSGTAGTNTILKTIKPR